MKLTVKLFLAAVMLLVAGTASAQYYEISNRIPQLIRPALSGSTAYKGFVDVSLLRSVGNYKTTSLDFATSQGFRYADWFYMGVGIGVDVLFAETNDSWGSGNNWDSSDRNHDSSTTAAMIPLFTDFRFTFGGTKADAGVVRAGTGFFIDLRIGCSFLCSDSWVRINDGYLTNQEYFYLRPSLGARFPVGEGGRKAVSVGLVYKLLTANYWNSYDNSITLNSMGLTVAFEW